MTLHVGYNNSRHHLSSTVHQTMQNIAKLGWQLLIQTRPSHNLDQHLHLIFTCWPLKESLSRQWNRIAATAPRTVNVVLAAVKDFYLLNDLFECCTDNVWKSAFSSCVSILTLTLIQPASKWMHWATLRRHSDLFWAATSTSSEVIPILNKSLLTVLLHFVRGRPGPLLNPGTSQCNACRGMRWWSIRITCPSQRNLLSLSMSSIA